jgi:hypothetical protein
MESSHELRAGPLEKLNGANIVIIPKVDLVEHPKDCRPISLINSFSKLITKTLSIGLSPHIGNMVSFTERLCEVAVYR